MMAIKAGDELYVNNKWFWDVLKTDQKTLTVQAYCTINSKNSKIKITLPLASITSFTDNIRYKSIAIKESDLKDVIDISLSELIIQPNLYDSIKKESFSNYPKTAVQCAKRALGLKNTVAATDITAAGWEKTRRIANGEPITLEYLKYLSSIKNRINEAKDLRTNIVLMSLGGNDMLNWAKDFLKEDTVGMGPVVSAGSPIVAGIPGAAGSDIAVSLYDKTITKFKKSNKNKGLIDNRHSRKDINKLIDIGKQINKPLHTTGLNSFKIGVPKYESADTDSTYKLNVLKFIDYPWQEDAEINFVNLINANRENIRNSSPQLIKNYIQRLNVENETAIFKLTSDKFQFELNQLLK